MVILLPKTPGTIEGGPKPRPGSQADLAGQIKALQDDLKTLQIRKPLSDNSRGGHEQRIREVEMKISQLHSDLEVKMRDSDRTSRMQRHPDFEDPTKRLPKSVSRRHMGTFDRPL